MNIKHIALIGAGLYLLSRISSGNPSTPAPITAQQQGFEPTYNEQIAGVTTATKISDMSVAGQALRQAIYANLTREKSIAIHPYDEQLADLRTALRYGDISTSSYNSQVTNIYSEIAKIANPFNTTMNQILSYNQQYLRMTL